MKPIITSLADTDAYSFSMGDFLWRRLRNAEGIDKFVNRRSIKFPNKFGHALQEQVEALGELRATDAPFDYLPKVWPHIPTDYLQWLRTDFRIDPKMIKIKQVGSDLFIDIEGPEYLKVYAEVPVLRLIPNLYYPMMGLQPIPEKEYRERARLKAKYLYDHKARWASFPTRRPASSLIHEHVIQEALPYKFNGEGGLVGESNLYLASKYELGLIGTMAHRLFIVFGALYGYDVATTLVLRMWDEEFNGNLGIALTDTFTTPFFLKYFTEEFANKFKGTREDSMIQPEAHAVMLSEHYRRLKIDPTTKTFSPTNGLNHIRAVELNDFVREHKLLAYSSAGIGGAWGNDAGLPPIDPVIKPFFTRWIGETKWRPCVKISDNRKKSTGDPKEQERALAIIDSVLSK